MSLLYTHHIASDAYGIYHWTGGRGGIVPDFVQIAREVFARPGFDRPLPEV